MKNEIQVTRNEALGRYEGHVGEQLVGYATFELDGDRTVLPHTVVPQEFGGQGYAGAIVQYALDDIRAQGRTVVPSCPYVASWIAKHPDHEDLVAQS